MLDLGSPGSRLHPTRAPPARTPPLTPTLSFSQIWDGQEPSLPLTQADISSHCVFATATVEPGNLEANNTANCYSATSLPPTDAKTSDNQERPDKACQMHSSFHTAIATGMEDFRSFVIREYEKDMSHLLGENQRLRQRLENPTIEEHARFGSLLCIPSHQASSCNGGSDSMVNQNLSRQTTPGNEAAQMRLPPGKSATSLESLTTTHTKLTILKSSSSMKTQADSGRIERHTMTHKLFQLQGENPGQVMARFTSQEFVNANGFQRFVSSNQFEMICGAIILANTVVIAVQLQYDGLDNAYLLGTLGIDKPAKDLWPGAAVAFLFCDFLFNVAFMVELVLRILVVRRKCFTSGWIWFDFVIVILGIVDLGTTVLMDGDGPGMGFDPTMIRLVRLVRLVRLFKILKAMSSFDSLFLLLKAIQASWVALTWSFLILGGVQIMLGLFLCQTLQAYIIDPKKDVDQRREVYKYFGTFSRTMITMFEITLANWVPSCRTLMENVHETFILFYIGYRCMFCFAVIKVIAAVFITETNRVLESDDELTMMKASRHKQAYMTKLKNMFERIDQNGDGAFDWQELQGLLQNENMCNYLSTLGFEKHDFEKLFWLLDDGSGEISIADFVSKVGKMKGQAKTIDILTMLKLTTRLERKMHEAFQKQGLIPKGNKISALDPTGSMFNND